MLTEIDINMFRSFSMALMALYEPQDYGGNGPTHQLHRQQCGFFANVELEVSRTNGEEHCTNSPLLYQSHKIVRHMQTGLYTKIYLYMHVICHICIYICIHTVYVFVCVYVLFLCITYIVIFMYVYIYIYIHVCVCAHVSVYVCVCLRVVIANLRWRPSR